MVARLDRDNKGRKDARISALAMVSLETSQRLLTINVSRLVQLFVYTTIITRDVGEHSDGDI